MHNRPPQMAEPERLLPLEDVIAKVRMSRSTIYRLMGIGNFPPRICIGDETGKPIKAPLWRESDLDIWIRGLATVQKT